MASQDAALPTTSARKRSGSITDRTTPTISRPIARFSDPPAEEIIMTDSKSNPSTEKDTTDVRKQQSRSDEPSSPATLKTPSKPGHDATLEREDSTRSVFSHQSNDSQDVDMADDDEGLDEEDRSENDSVASDSQPPSKKKKKGQRFYCTDFPPCQLSFTRSEHLARHIRKHTGERPFQCHCSRRFSRLDNLRQHAQTVHVNEDIPGDSLAATGTRFQRQIRTDRVRTTNARPRASTASSNGGHSRGHSRNLSASSVMSTASSIVSDDGRSRPSSLALSQDGTARARLTLDTFNPAIGTAGTQYGYFHSPPSGYSTPTSATFSNAPSSPHYSSAMQSPPSSLHRSTHWNGARTPSRRLSAPFGASPYQSAGQPLTYPPPFSSPGQPSAASTISTAGSTLGSPTGSVFSHGRRDSDADLEWRRRTWHPGTQSNYAPRPATSGLSYHQTPDDLAPAPSSQPAASQITRLPGIESFDHVPPPPSTVSSRNATSPHMQIEGNNRLAPYPQGNEGYAPMTGYHGSDAGLHQNLTKLEIGTGSLPKEGANWPGPGHARTLSHMRPTTAPHTGFAHHYGPAIAAPPLQAAAEIRGDANEGVAGGRKRQAWYGVQPSIPKGSQPITIAHRTSPESSSSDGVPTPSTSHGKDTHPVIRHANGNMDIGLSEEQQAMMRAHYHGKPEPIRADSGFHSYPQAYGQYPHSVTNATAQLPLAPPPPPQPSRPHPHPHPHPAQQATYVMQSGHDPQQMQHAYVQAPPRASNDMGRLEALVAVATSENRAVEHRS